MSQGFIEPLEATALMLIQYTIENFLHSYSDAGPTGKTKDSQQLVFNQLINNMMEGIRDYIVAHYVTNSKTDSAHAQQYWQQCRQVPVSENLALLLSSWRSNDNFDQALQQVGSKLAYLRPSWYVLLAGMGVFPNALNNPNQSAHASDAHPNAANITALQARQYCQDLVKDVF